MSIYIYCRVSTVQQNDGLGLDAQEKKCRDFLTGLLSKDEWQRRFKSLVDASGKLKAHVVKEQVSGSVPFQKRPQAAALLARLRKGDHLCFAKLDRAFRSARDCHNTLAVLKETGVSTSICDLYGGEDVTGNGIAQLLIGIMASVAEWERERIGERTKDAKRAAQAKGMYLGGKIPWDKKIVDGRLVDDEAKQSLVEQLKKWRRDAVPLRDCQARLMEQHGASLSVDAIRRLTADDTAEAARKRGRRKRVGSARSAAGASAV
ncbi:MAG TPA: recombinase family protein [Vicinamibacterales bacterium]|nr:recombinase family protein [Vicinamibacterales bacterium]HPW21170.1 recombinase family protein [Vicinamibacterales bacterium]